MVANSILIWHRQKKYCCLDSLLVFKSKHDGIFGRAEPEIHDPVILSVNRSLHRFKIPASTFTRKTKFLGRPFQDILHRAVTVRYGLVSYDMGKRRQFGVDLGEIKCCEAMVGKSTWSVHS